MPRLHVHLSDAAEESRQQIDVYAQAIAETLIALSASLDKHVITLRRRRNTLAPIHTLPLELLVQIIFFVLDDHGTSWYQHLHALSTVSSAWMDVIHHTPAFWTNIHSSDPANVTFRALERSQGCPISVMFRFYRTGSADQLSTKEFLQLVGGQMQRCSSLDIHLWISPAGSLCVLESPAPSLKRLNLAVMRPRFMFEDVVLDLLSDHAPQLKDLQLCKVGARNWSSSIFKGLRVLAIDGSPTSMPSLDQIMEMLRSNLELETLRLHHPPDLAMVQSQQSVISPFIFPRLTKIDLHGFPEHPLATILSSIDAPNCSSLHIGAPKSPDAPSTSFVLASAIDSSLSTFKGHLRDGGELTVKLGASCFSCVWQKASADRYFCMDLRRVSHVLRPLQWFVDTFRDVEPLSVVLVNDFDFGAEAITSLLWTLDSVKGSEVAGNASNIDQLFIDLSNASVRDGFRRWPLPNLRRLRIRSTAFDEAHALQMVQLRYGTRGPSDTELQPPAPLEELLFQDLSDETFAAMQQIVGIPCFVLDAREDDDMEDDEFEENVHSESEEEVEGTESIVVTEDEN